MERDLNATHFQATVGLAMFILGLGLLPLVSTSFSEEFGRQPLYIGSVIGCLLSHVMAALYVYHNIFRYIRMASRPTSNQASASAPNIQTVIIARFLAGTFASTSSAMVGGTIADIFVPRE